MLKPHIFGQGLSFPPRVDAQGRLAWSAGEANVRESLQLLLLTEPGERLMRESFGCGLRQFLFEPNTPATRELIRLKVTKAIERWEPRVALETVNVEPADSDPNRIDITILFRLIATQMLERLGMSIQLEG